MIANGLAFGMWLGGFARGAEDAAELIANSAQTEWLAWAALVTADAGLYQYGYACGMAWVAFLAAEVPS